MRGSLQHTGALAQLGERLICIQEVRSSILLGSTITSGHQHDHQAHLWMSLIVLLDARDPRDRFTSFREIHISVMSVFPSGGGPAAHLALQDMRLSKSSTLTKCSECQHTQSGKRTMLLVQIVEQGTQKALFVMRYL